MLLSLVVVIVLLCYSMHCSALGQHWRLIQTFRCFECLCACMEKSHIMFSLGRMCMTEWKAIPFQRCMCAYHFEAVRVPAHCVYWVFGAPVRWYLKPGINMFNVYTFALLYTSYVNWKTWHKRREWVQYQQQQRIVHASNYTIIRMLGTKWFAWFHKMFYAFVRIHSDMVKWADWAGNERVCVLPVFFLFFS